VGGSMPSEDTGSQKRRSTRIVQAVPITVSGVDALGQPFKERTTTVMVNCHGCKYQSKHYVPKNNMVSLEIARPEASLTARTVLGRVIWVQRPRAIRELFQIGLEFDTPGNVWGIAFPPEDWFPYPEQEASAPPPVSVTLPPAASKAPAPPQAGPETQPTESKIHVVSSTSQEDRLDAARQTARMVAEAKETLEKTLRRSAQSAVNEEMTVVRQQLDAQLHEAVERAIKLSMERVSESAAKKLIHQASERTSNLVEEARKATELRASQLDAKIREAVNNAAVQAAEQAAQQAAQHTTAQNLKQAVEEVVRRLIPQTEAASPWLGIPSAPQEASQQLHSWKASLAEAAQDIRSKTVDQTQADAAAARQHWLEEFEATVSGASKTFDEKIAVSWQAAFSRAEQEMSAHQSTVRESLDSAIADAQKWIQSLGAGLEQQRTAAENVRREIEQAGHRTVEQTRQQLEEMLSAQQAEARLRAEQAIAEKLDSIEPAVRDSAQKVVDRLSSELEQTLRSQLEATRNARAELARARDEASGFETRIREQVQQALERTTQIETNLQRQAQHLSQQTARAESTVRETAQQALREVLERVRQESETLPTKFDESSRAVLAKLEDEFDQKNTEAKHDTYEALAKAADWYQKKAQTTMQSALEKAVEQSTAALRGRAAEISSLVASELDHYRRSYVEHSQAEIDEAAREIIDRERSRMGESAETAQASFTDRVQQLTGDSLRRFEAASREALEKARSDVEYTREQSLAEFQKKMEMRITEGVEQAEMHLQSQFAPIVEVWDSKHQQQRTEFLEQLKRSADESIEQYKTRLENASNSWLLASATTLGQHSQAVLDTLAKSAEKRMRDTIAEVLAGMGDTLKNRLLGISTNFSSEEDEEPPKTR